MISTQENSDKSALLANILAHADVDLYRLVLADYVQDTEGRKGQIEADFIRTQIAGELAPLPMSMGMALEPIIGGLSHQWNRSSEKGKAVLVCGFVELTYRRGFVAEVRAPMDWLIGGVCGCENGSIDSGGFAPWGEPISLQCNTCQGTGRTPGHLREIVKTQPVEFVMVSDREPWEPLVAYCDFSACFSRRLLAERLTCGPTLTCTG